MTTYTNFLKLRTQVLGEGSWDVLLNQSLAILDFAHGARTTGNRLLAGGVVSAGTGLNANYALVLCEVGGVRFEVAAGSIAVATGINYLYVNGSGAVVSAASPPSGDYVPLAVVDGGASAIDRVGDARTMAQAVVADNIFINGDCAIDQENGGAAVSVSTTAKYFVDMLKCSETNHTAVVNAQRVIGFGGFSYAGKLTVTTGATLVSGKYGHGLQVFIEHKNCQLVAGRYLAVKFKFQAKLAGTYSVSLQSGDASNSYVTTISYPSAEAVQDIALLIPVPSAKVIEGSNGRGLILHIGKAAVGTKATASLNQWQSGDYVAATTGTDWETTVGNYIALTGLHGGVDQAPVTFPFRQFARELELCKRYYERGTSARPLANAIYTNSVQTDFISFATEKIRTPAMTTSTPTYAAPAGLGTVGAAGSYLQTTGGFSVYFDSTGTTIGTGGRLNFDWVADARM